MKYNFFLLVALIILDSCSGRRARKSEIIHMDFCDVMSKIEDQPPSSSQIYNKLLRYIVDDTGSGEETDSTIGKFIQNDEFIQAEIHNEYYRLDITFYKKTKGTEQLLKSRSGRYLDYCEEDVIFQY